MNFNILFLKLLNNNCIYNNIEYNIKYFYNIILFVLFDIVK